MPKEEMPFCEESTVLWDVDAGFVVGLVVGLGAVVAVGLGVGVASVLASEFSVVSEETEGFFVGFVVEFPPNACGGGVTGAGGAAVGAGIGWSDGVAVGVGAAVGDGVAVGRTGIGVGVGTTVGEGLGVGLGDCVGTTFSVYFASTRKASPTAVSEVNSFSCANHPTNSKPSF